ncbi:M23 family peptidase [Mesobaculum littorinae]|uniref:M23 family peptidase n=1 Tax=Mesobaculum littorinae TaxID=2486419 RepID=A0A438AL92_9RHOB|nr:M23 family metallopeptidase [Mesobaculum littorinae]RVV99440.1 M23 family peptidase [Mesobaculum littorinae]
MGVKLNAMLGRAFPEQRLFLRSDTETRFVRLSPVTQLIGLSGSALVVGWSIIATSIILMDSIGSGNVRDQAKREQALYEQRLNALSQERDARAEEASEAIDRFNAALTQVSQMQSSLLSSETRRRELETGIEVIQTTLRRTMTERDAARGEVQALTTEIEGTQDAGLTEAQKLADYESTVDYLAAALGDTAEERDVMADEAAEAEAFAEELILDARLQQERNDEIFTKLEDALTISVKPLDKMFSSAGLSTDSLLDSVRRGYSGQGGPLTPLTVSTKGMAAAADSARANGILEKLDEMNLYRIAAQKAPFDVPLKDSFRFTSGFGQRWGRMHEGTDFAAAYGTPIYATADGVVTYAGTMSGYGRLVKIEHEFGIETRYAHQSKIRVKVGQRVSRGDRIGDMGNSGRSTGTHLHYEVRVGGKPVNPMTYIKAAKDVF